MRLLKANADDSLSLITFLSRKVPSYAILSHTWETDNQEVTFQDLMNNVGYVRLATERYNFVENKPRKTVCNTSG
jgi:hypothetical protein